MIKLAEEILGSQKKFVEKTRKESKIEFKQAGREQS